MALHMTRYEARLYENLGGLKADLYRMQVVFTWGLRVNAGIVGRVSASGYDLRFKISKRQ